MKRATRFPSPLDVYEIRVALRDIEPPVCRRLRVSARVTLAELHEALQLAFGWQNSHLHDFTVGDARFGLIDDELDTLVVDERAAPLGAIAREGTTFMYRYDFGDDWEHEIVVERAVDGAREITLECASGERAGPPEDSGGPHGYAGMLETVRDPKHADHAEVRRWLPKRFDPEHFDVDATNKKLATLRRKIDRRR